MTQIRNEPDPDRYLGRGKLRGAEARDQARERQPRRDRRRARPATGAQPRGRAGRARDRPHRGDPRHLRRATRHTAEGKLQVELAQLEYNLAACGGSGRTSSASAQGEWTVASAPGALVSPEIETDRRLARDPDLGASAAPARPREEPRGDARQARFRRAPDGRARRLHERRQVDAAQCDHRRRGRGGDRLFHTLDPTTRSYRHDGRDYLMTDTVGFIRKLPHQLVEAFMATLEETRLADLIVHVVDGSEPEADRRGAIEAGGRRARGARRRRSAPSGRLQQARPAR